MRFHPRKLGAELGLFTFLGISSHARIRESERKFGSMGRRRLASASIPRIIVTPHKDRSSHFATRCHSFSTVLYRAVLQTCRAGMRTFKPARKPHRSSYPGFHPALRFSDLSERSGLRVQHEPRHSLLEFISQQLALLRHLHIILHILNNRFPVERPRLPLLYLALQIRVPVACIIVM